MWSHFLEAPDVPVFLVERMTHATANEFPDLFYVIRFFASPRAAAQSCAF
jgi:hypothetical protein